jgi:chromosome segregation ATPase
VVLSSLSTYERGGRKETEEEEEAQWGELLARVDFSRFSKFFRSLVLLAGLLRLRESSEAALRDLRGITSETEAYSKRISSAKSMHPEARILEAIQRNLQEFSSQTQNFQDALQSSELRMELELLALSLRLSRSTSSETKAERIRLTRRITKLARYIRAKEEKSKELDILSKIFESLKEQREKGQKEGGHDPKQSRDSTSRMTRGTHRSDPQ